MSSWIKMINDEDADEELKIALNEAAVGLMWIFWFEGVFKLESPLENLFEALCCLQLRLQPANPMETQIVRQ